MFLTPRLANDIEMDGTQWSAYYQLESPEEAPLPGGYDVSLSAFEQLLVLRCLRMDRVTLGITRFVMNTLGEKYVSPPTLDYNAIFRQSNETTPVVFVLSPGG